MCGNLESGLELCIQAVGSHSIINRVRPGMFRGSGVQISCGLV